MPCRKVRGIEVLPWYPGRAAPAHRMHDLCPLWPFVGLVALFLSSGCARSLQGVLSVDPTRGLTVEHVYGGSTKLAVDGEDKLLLALEGHSVVVEGRASPSAVRVENWRVLEGPHALPVWIGELQLRGGELGLFDRNSELFYYLEKASAKQLYSDVGKWVVLEGFVDGPHTVRVMYYDVLDPSTQDVSVSD